MDSDPDIEFIETADSGMSSLGGSKDETPERRPLIEDIDDELDVGGGGDIAVVELAKDEIEEILGPVDTVAEPAESYDDEPEETLGERLWGLTEMFPERLRYACAATTDISIASTKALYGFTCSASWIFFTSSMILFAPILCEVELAQMKELERTQQKQVLLGPGSAISSTGGPALPPMTR